MINLDFWIVLMVNSCWNLDFLRKKMIRDDCKSISNDNSLFRANKIAHRTSVLQNWESMVWFVVETAKCVIRKTCVICIGYVRDIYYEINPAVFKCCKNLRLISKSWFCTRMTTKAITGLSFQKLSMRSCFVATVARF